MGTKYHTHCFICKLKLVGKQQKYCSDKCRNDDHQGYSNQKSRGLRKKIEYVNKKGGKCEICGYDKNLASLVFHHIDPSVKSFGLDMRRLSNSSQERSDAEFAKCQLLCNNCHNEIHHPELSFWQEWDKN